MRRLKMLTRRLRTVLAVGGLGALAILALPCSGAEAAPSEEESLLEARFAAIDEQQEELADELRELSRETRTLAREVSALTGGHDGA